MRFLRALCFCLLVSGVALTLTSGCHAQSGSTTSPTESTVVQPAQTDQSAAAALEAEESAAVSEEAEPTVWSNLMTPKYLLFLLLAAVGLVLVLMRWVNIWVRIGMLLVAFVLFGLDQAFPLHPSPMCGITQLFMFRFTLGTFFPALLVIFLAVIVPSLIGRKLFCGWVCPLGALQDLINKIPFKPRFKQFDFTAFNTVRMSLLALFFLTFFAVKDQIATLAEYSQNDPSNQVWVAFSSYSLYDPINFFELLHWGLDTTFYIMMAILVIASLMLYRPFCYLICPIGALTWLCEKIAPGRVRVDKVKCNSCMRCVDASPCPTIRKLVAKKTLAAPDCTSCGECLRSCPEDAIKFSFWK
jgi:polyferredoxin